MKDGFSVKVIAEQYQNKYFKKQFSILGDSISTLVGYNPEGYKVFYSGDNCVQSGVVNVTDTWWDKVIGFFGGQLLVNNSWSGSRVTKLPYAGGIYPEEFADEPIPLFPSGCSDERTSALHVGDVKPDVILVYLGTNDWAFGAKLGDEIYLWDEDENESFEYAYDNMLKKLENNYPQSEIWCCTLCETYMKKHSDFQFPHKYRGKHIEEYNDVIRRVVRDRGCKIIDLYNFRIPYDTVDGSHPTMTGMNGIATMVIRSMVDSQAVEEECPSEKIIAERYKILSKIGKGGCFEVYHVLDVRCSKVWEMKVCDKKDRNVPSVIRDMILKEACMLKKLAHPAIPRVIDIWEDDEVLYIIRDYIEGETLKTIVTKQGAQPPEKIVEWGKQLCDALGYLHSQTPLHIYRDMKPANIMLKKDGRVMIIDFDTVCTYKENLKGDTCILGTKGYAAPEQYGVAQSDARTDIYGLGMTMAHLVTGQSPCVPPYVIDPIRTYNPELPAGLEYIISKCVQPNPADRYQSCEELMGDLNNYLNLPKRKRILSRLFGKK